MPGERTVQFLLHTKPSISPEDAVRFVKGRLQYLIKSEVPKAYRKNYSIKSIGQAKAQVVEEYVSSQLSHHRMADPRVNKMMQKCQLSFPEIDLSAVRYTSHGQFIYNLHLVYVHQRRFNEISESALRASVVMIKKTAKSQKHLLRTAGILSDHIHIALGCGIDNTPQNVALSYMNNLAYAHDMKCIYQYGYFAGTFGQYDLGAV